MRLRYILTVGYPTVRLRLEAPAWPVLISPEDSAGGSVRAERRTTAASTSAAAASPAPVPNAR